MSKKLSLFLTGSAVPISLSPLKSDYWGNLVIMEQVVGTMVKYNESGISEPYLIERWEVSEDERIWKFHFRKELFDESGEVINAVTFNKSIRRLLKLYSKSYDPPTFSLLNGWKNFKAGNQESLGIIAINDLILEMSFEKRPSGLLEFLAMPYYGFYNIENFNDAGDWKDEFSIISSAAYRVGEATKDTVHLVSRPTWHTFQRSAPSDIYISNSNFENALKNVDHPVMISLKGVSEEHSNIVSGFRAYNSTSTLLTSIILSPYLQPFNDSEVRLAFRSLIRYSLHNLIDSNRNVNVSPYFYPTYLDKFALSDIELSKAITTLRSLGALKIKIFRQALTTSADSELVDLLLSNVSELSGWSFQVDTPEKIGSDWQQKAFSNRSYPIRVARVDIGGSPENWVIEMMFCSQLGVSFPDSNGAVCRLVNDYTDYKVIGREAYHKRFHDAIESEGSVIPLIYSGLGWLISDHISLKNLSPTMSLPRFDRLEIK